MYCRNCGKEIPDKALVCGDCGTPVREEDRPKDAWKDEQTVQSSPSDNFREIPEQELTANRKNRWDLREEQPASPYSYGTRAPRYGTQRTVIEPTGGEGLAQAAIVLALLSIPLCIVPFLAIPTSLMAIVFGILGRDSTRRTRAIVAIILGSILLLTAIVLTISIAALIPYSDELNRLLEEYMRTIQ